MTTEVVDANVSEAVTGTGITGIAEDGEMSMGSFLEEIQKKSKERRITVGRVNHLLFRRFFLNF